MGYAQFLFELCVCEVGGTDNSVSGSVSLKGIENEKDWVMYEKDVSLKHSDEML